MASHSGSGVRLEVDAADRYLVIREFLASDAAFVGAVRLHAIDEVGGVRALFSDLANKDDPTEAVARASLSVTGVGKMAKDEYTDVLVKVEKVTAPGTYCGMLELLADGQARGDAAQVKIEVTRCRVRC